MPLNINLISHPIIKQLSNQLIQHQNKKNYRPYHNHHELYSLLIYEITRKWIKGHNIYIKHIDNIIERYTFDSQESYLIIMNLMNSGNTINTITKILPKVYFQHINLDKQKTKNYCIDDSILNTIEQQKIIIIDSFLTNNSIINFLDYLLINKNIFIKNIKIICITCNNSILEYMGKKYKSLDIYTTHINYY